MPPTDLSTSRVITLMTIALTGWLSPWLIATSRASEPLPRVWHPSDLHMEVEELTREERWSDAIEALLAEPLDHLSRKHQDEAKAVLLASVTRLDRARGINETSNLMKKRPHPSTALVTLLALQDRCDHALQLAKRVIGPDASSARFVALGCEIRLGKRQRAVEAWRKWKRLVKGDGELIRSALLPLSWSIPRNTGDGDRRAALSRAHGATTSPSATPGIVPEGEQRDIDAWYDVLAIDCRFESEGPFGPQFSDDLFERDLSLAKAAFSKDAPRLAELDLLVMACREEEDGWPLDTLPSHSPLFEFVRSTIHQPTDDEAGQILERLGFELERRADAGDVAAWRALLRLELQVAKGGGRIPLWQLLKQSLLSPANQTKSSDWTEHFLGRARFGLERFGEEQAAEIIVHHEALDSATSRALIARFPHSYLVANQRLHRAVEAFQENQISELQFDEHIFGVAQTMVMRFGREADLQDLERVMNLLENAPR